MLNHGLVFEKVYGVIKFNRKNLTKTKHWYKDRAGKKAKHDSKKHFLTRWIIQFSIKPLKMPENIDL